MDDKWRPNHHVCYETVNSSNSFIIVIVIFETKTQLKVVVVVLLSLFFE